MTAKFYGSHKRLIHLEEDLEGSTSHPERSGEEEKKRGSQLHHMVPHSLYLVDGLWGLVEIVAEGVGHWLCLDSGTNL